MYECYNCRSMSVVWDADFDLEDYGMEGIGVVGEYHCAKCGAEITCIVRENNEGEQEDEE